MLNLTFNLKIPKGDTETSILCVIRYNNLRLKYYTGERIHPKHWENRKINKRYQSAKSSLIEAPELNARLSKIQTTVTNVFRKYQNENNNNVPSVDVLKGLLDKAFSRGIASPNTLMSFFLEIINQSKAGVRLHPKTGKPISKNTIKTYATTYKHLTEYQLRKKKVISFEDINLEFYTDFNEFLTKHLKLATNSIAKHTQILKLIMNDATERGLNTNLAFKSKRFAVIRERSDSIYLTEYELKGIEALDLCNDVRLEKVRDLFLIGCYTGLRYSDYSILQAEQIRDGFIVTDQVKTGEQVVIPIHPIVENIIKKYNNKVPASISNQKTNEYLKELGKLLPCLQTNFTVTYTKAGKKVVETFAKWELLTSHTARRSFATNEYKAGTPPITIMAITGHKTESSFMKYIKLTSTEHAKLLKEHWAKRSAILRAI